MLEILSYQPNLRQVIPTTQGCIEYQEFCDLLSTIDELIVKNKLDNFYIQKYVENILQNNPNKKHSPKYIIKIQNNARTAFRCGLLRKITGESLRVFHIRLADSSIMQWFVSINEVSKNRVPSKSQLERSEKTFSKKMIDDIIATLFSRIQDSDVEDSCDKELKEFVTLENLYFDSTCVKTHVHFPVDWVLFRDAIRTLVKSIIIIRKHGLLHRMDDPTKFITKINKLCIQMAQAQRAKDGKRKRKNTLRLMKKLLKVVEAHAYRHKNLLENNWENAGFSFNEKEQVLSRMNNILMQIDDVIYQAHERIIGERIVQNNKKIFSLYERDTRIIGRKKAGAEVEFGNTLLLGEQENGLICNWKFFKEQAPADSKMLIGAIKEIKNAFSDFKILSASTDRGFDSKENFQFLDQENIENNICPKGPAELQKKLKIKSFVKHQKKRSQTETRIAIVKNNFIGETLLSKGYANRESQIGIAILVHNLWVLSKFIISIKKKKKIAA